MEFRSLTEEGHKKTYPAQNLEQPGWENTSTVEKIRDK